MGDMVIHGIDYSLLVLPQRKRDFVTELATHVVEAVNKQGTGAAVNADVDAVKKDIRVVVTPTSGHTLMVRAEIPVTNAIWGTATTDPTLATNIDTLETELESKKADIKTALETEVRKMDAVKYIATWTKDSVFVKSPGEQ